MLPEVFRKFVEASPVSVMVGGILERVLHAEPLDRLFEATAERQYVRSLLFSDCVRVMSDVVFRKSAGISDWSRMHPGELPVSLQAVYQKLAGIEPNVAAEFVRQTAADLGKVRRAMGSVRPRPLPGYRLRVLDGTHLAGTEHRLLETRRYRAATLPGQALLFYDPRLDQVEDVIPCEDSYAQERSLTDEILERVRPRDAIVADRNFCTTRIVFGLARRGAFFAIRQHASTLSRESLGRRTRIGKDEQGRWISEEPVRLSDGDETLDVRRIRVPLPKSGRQGERELFVLTNLPAEDADAVTVARLYADRWSIETAIQHLKGNFRCEVDTLAYPKAALFGLCVALVAYNVVSLTTGALRAAQGREFVEEELSWHYLTTDVARTEAGLRIAVPDEHWTVFAQMTIADLARTLVDLAARLDKHKYLKHKRGPKRPQPKKIVPKNQKHVSTARLLAARE